MPKRMPLFLHISSYLTGFEQVDLEATGLTQTYFNCLCTNTKPETLKLFFTEVAVIFKEGRNNPDQINALIASRLMPTSNYDNLAQNIIFMWYMGQWAPTVQASNVNLATVTNISANAYIQGLVWAAANTHPPGAKQPGYASWAYPPMLVKSC